MCTICKWNLSNKHLPWFSRSRPFSFLLNWQPARLVFLLEIASLFSWWGHTYSGVTVLILQQLHSSLAFALAWNINCTSRRTVILHLFCMCAEVRAFLHTSESMWWLSHLIVFFFCLFFAGLLKLNKNTKFSPLFYSIPCSCLVPGGVAECRIDIHCWYLPHRKIKQRALCVSGTHINYLCGSSTRDVYVQRHASCTWWGSKSHPTTAPALPLRAVHPERVKNERHQNRSKELLQSSCTVKLILIKIDYSIWATWVINF